MSRLTDGLILEFPGTSNPWGSNIFIILGSVAISIANISAILFVKILDNFVLKEIYPPITYIAPPYVAWLSMN